MINQIIQKKVSITALASTSGRDYKYLDVEPYGVFVWSSTGTVDSIFVFAALNGGVWTYDVLSSKGVYKVSMAKILAGDAGDKTSVLNDIFAHSGVKTVLVDAQQTITLNLVLTIPSGKVLQIEPGGSFTGSGTINGGIMDISNVLASITEVFGGTITRNFDHVINGTLQYTNFGSFPVLGKTGKLYIDIATPAAYLWDGGTYVSTAGVGAGATVIVPVTSTPHNAAQTSGDIIFLINCTTAGGPVTINLPTAVGNAAEFTFKKIDAGADIFTVDPFGGETIDGETTAIVRFQNTAFSIKSDNVNWQRV